EAAKEEGKDGRSKETAEDQATQGKKILKQMEDVGSLIFYIVLGLIALAGSFQGKGKKKQGTPKPAQRKPGTVTTKPPVRTTAQTTRPAPSTMRQERPAPSTVRQERSVPKPSPWTIPAGQTLEGRYDE